MPGFSERIRGFVGIAGVAALVFAAPAFAQDEAPGSGALIKLDNEIGVQLYLGGGTSRSQSFQGKIKGTSLFPMPAGFGNTGSDHDRSNMIDVVFGAATQVGAVMLRGELEYTAQRSFDLTTNGFPGGGGTPFFYRTKIENRTTFANLWVDYALQNLFEGASGLYVTAGGGIGTSHTDLRVIDFPLTGPGRSATGGSDSQTAAAWMLGLGVGYAVTDWMTVDLGVRRVDLGRIDTGLQSVVGPVPVSTGSFGVDMESDEAFARVRVNFLGL